MWPAIAGVATGAVVLVEIIDDLTAKLAPKKKAPTPRPAPKVGPRGHVMTGDAALDMNTLLGFHGYKLSDQGVYRLFQAKVGLSTDGFPGAHTMAALENDLAERSPPVKMATVPIYPWHNQPNGYDGVNAPTYQQWIGG